MGQVDTRWQQHYNSGTLWFQFTPQQLAALYNERHPLSETLHLEQNGMAFSPSVPERTPRTSITADGQAWVDFSASSLQHNGKHDGGDALELAARRNGESKAAKSNTLREAAQQTATAQHISHEDHQELNSLEALAAEIEALIGEPCGQCGCTLFYQSGPYRMCHLCYPRPEKFGRLTDKQWQRLRSVFPRNPEPSDLIKRNK